MVYFRDFHTTAIRQNARSHSSPFFSSAIFGSSSSPACFGRSPGRNHTFFAKKREALWNFPSWQVNPVISENLGSSAGNNSSESTINGSGQSRHPENFHRVLRWQRLSSTIVSSALDLCPTRLTSPKTGCFSPWKRLETAWHGRSSLKNGQAVQLLCSSCSQLGRKKLSGGTGRKAAHLSCSQQNKDMKPSVEFPKSQIMRPEKRCDKNMRFPKSCGVRFS